jgi:predicted nucleic acid-binding protein
VSLVVSDSGPVQYLVLCQAMEVLPKLYGQLVIPTAVSLELSHPHTPAQVSRWVQALPKWASIKAPARVDFLRQLGPGEREAIALAHELKATQLLIDDRAARRVATQGGLLTTGTVGILELAAIRGFLSLPETMRKLLSTNFRIDADVVRDALDRDRARRGGGA